MYLWKIEKLKHVLAKRPLSQEEAFKYIIYFVVVYRIGTLWGAPTKDSIYSTWPWWATMSAFLASTILEVFACYKLNGGKNGSDFLGRYLSIRLLTSIRLFVYFWLAIILLLILFCFEFQGEISACFAAHPLYVQVFKYIVGLFWTVLLPLRVIMHMRSLNRSTANFKQS